MRKPAIQSRSAPVWLLAVVLALVTTALYWPATRYDFVNFDDTDYVTANPQVQGGLSWESVKWAFVHPVSANWHPLTMLSHMLDCQLFGLNPWGHHLVNVLFHALNAALVFGLLRVLTGATWRSLMVAALFAVHPLRVESVAWVSERKDVLSGFFGLLALVFYARYAQKRSRAGGLALDARHSTLDYLLALFFFALGLLSKPMLVTWPFVMLLLDYWPLRRLELSTIWRLVIEKIPFFALAAVTSVVTFVVQKQGGSVPGGEELPLGARVGNALVSYCRYLGKMIWPTDLAVFYPHPGYWPLATVLLAGLLLVAIPVLFFVKRRRYPFLLVGWLWFCGMLVPMIGLVQTGGQAMADRHTYLPSLGVLILIIWGANELTRHWRHRRMVSSVAGSASIVLCFALTRQQLGYWQDSETLFRHALAVTEDNYFARNNLGTALFFKKGRVDEAISQFQKAIRLDPNDTAAHNNLGIALDKQSQTGAAISQYREAIRLDPGSVAAHYNLGIALDQQGQIDEAIRQYQETIRLKPDYAEAHNNLGIALSQQGQLDKAIGQYQEAIHLKPDYAEAYNNLGTILDQKGQIGAAINQYQEAIRLKPDYAEAHYVLGIALDKQGQIGAAISQYQEAIRLKPDYAEAHNNLGIAFGKQGQIGAAISQCQEAIRLKPGYAEAHYNLGIALDLQGRLDEAIGQYQEAVRLKPDYADAHNNLGRDLAAKGRLNEAIENYRRAIQINPNSFEALNNLGNALADEGRLDEAIGNYRQAIQINSNRPEPFFLLGMTFGQLGRTREAAAEYREALKLDPDLVGALNNLAWILAASPDDPLRNGAEAVRLAEHACELTHYGQPQFLGTLAAAYAEAGRYPEAVTMAEKAEQLATAAGLTAVAAKNRQLLELYRAGKPYHEPVPTGR